MKKDQFPFYFTFFKSTLALNLPVSLAVCIFSFSGDHLAKAMITAGFAFSVFYKELTRKNEYYFYYNAGISKIKLLAITFLLTLLTAAIIAGISRL